MNHPPENPLLTVFSPFPQFVLEAAKTALVIVDMQYLEAHPDWGLRARSTARQLIGSSTTWRLIPCSSAEWSPTAAWRAQSAMPLILDTGY